MMTIGQAKEFIKSLYRKMYETGDPWSVPAVFMMGPPGVGKCLDGSTFVVADGKVRRLKSIVDERVKNLHNPGFNDLEIPVSTESFDGNPRLVEKVYAETTKTIELVTETGHRLKGAEDHLILVLDKSGVFKYKKLKEIQKGEYVVVVPKFIEGGDNSLPEFDYSKSPREKDVRIPDRMTPELAYILGLLLGDGSIKSTRFRGKNRCGIQIAVHPEMVDKVSEDFYKIFGFYPIVKEKSSNCSTLYMHSSMLVNFIENLGIKEREKSEVGVKKGKEIEDRFEELIMKSTADCRIAFLAGLIDSDGSIVQGRKEIPKAIKIVGNREKKLAELAQKVCNTLGVFTVVDRAEKQEKPFYSCIAWGINATILANFIEELKHPEKNLLLQKLKSKTVERLRDSIDRYQFLPKEIRKKLILAVENLRKQGISFTREDYRNAKWKTIRGKDSCRIHPEVVKNAEKIFGIKVMDVPKDFRFVKVVSKKDSGECRVYDLSISTDDESLRNYWADGFIVHNSAIVKQAVAELSNELGIRMELLDVRLSQFDPTDIKGLPRIEKDFVDWILPKIWPRSGHGIIFFDELNLAPPTVQAAAYQIILDRQIGTFSFPPGFLICAAGNPPEQAKIAYPLPPPLVNRFVKVDVTISFDEWYEWALNAGIHPEVIGFLLPPYRREKYLLTISEEIPPDQPFASPRSWEFVHKLLNAIDNESILEPAIEGAVGSAVGKEFNAWRKQASVIADIPEQIILGKQPNIVEVIEKHSSAEFRRLDILYFCLNAALEAIGRFDYVSVEDAVTNFANYLLYLYSISDQHPDIIPKDVVVVFGEKLLERYEEYIPDSLLEMIEPWIVEEVEFEEL